MLRVPAPCRFYERHWDAELALCPSPLQNVIKIVFVSIAVLPRHFALTTSGFTWALEVEIEPVSLGNVCEHIANENFKNVPDDLSPPMSERFCHDLSWPLSVNPKMPLAERHAVFAVFPFDVSVAELLK